VGIYTIDTPLWAISVLHLIEICRLCRDYCWVLGG